MHTIKFKHDKNTDSFILSRRDLMKAANLVKSVNNAWKAYSKAYKEIGLENLKMDESQIKKHPRLLNFRNRAMDWVIKSAFYGIGGGVDGHDWFTFPVTEQDLKRNRIDTSDWKDLEHLIRGE